MSIKTYTGLMSLKTFSERLNYLMIGGKIGFETFGSHRYLNQKFYSSSEWLIVRNHIITRDRGCDMGISEYEISGPIIIHHINPITIDDIVNGRDALFDPENLICVSSITHRAIHYGTDAMLFDHTIDRAPNDTCPWKTRRK